MGGAAREEGLLRLAKEMYGLLYDEKDCTDEDLVLYYYLECKVVGGLELSRIAFHYDKSQSGKPLSVQF